MCESAEERALRASAEFADVSVPSEDAEVSHDETQSNRHEPATIEYS